MGAVNDLWCNFSGFFWRASVKLAGIVLSWSCDYSESPELVQDEKSLYFYKILTRTSCTALCGEIWGWEWHVFINTKGNVDWDWSYNFLTALGSQSVKLETTRTCTQAAKHFAIAVFTNIWLNFTLFSSLFQPSLQSLWFGHIFTITSFATSIIIKLYITIIALSSLLPFSAGFCEITQSWEIC